MSPDDDGPEEVENPAQGGGVPFRPPGGGRAQAEDAERPDLPDDLDLDLPSGVMAGIRQSAGEDSRDVAVALTLGAEAIEADQPELALEYLPWARAKAPTSPDVREALGVALYRDGQYQQALSQLRTYRRLSGRQDQNHVIADCLRALERAPAEVADDIQAMLDDEGVAAERRVEGVIVWAGSVADAGDLPGARSVLRNADDIVHDLPPEDQTGLARLWYMEGDLADRAGEPEVARRHFEAVLDAEADSFDARERLERLTGDQTG